MVMGRTKRAGGGSASGWSEKDGEGKKRNKLRRVWKL